MYNQAFRDRNRMAVDKLIEEGTYNETLRNIVEEMGILGPRASAKDSHFIFQTIDGDQRTPDQIVNRLRRQNLDIIDNGKNGIEVNVGDFINDARPRSAKKGIVEVDIKDMIRPNTSMPGWTPQTMGGVNNQDSVHRARFLPEEPLAEKSENLIRAQRIGQAEATGDLKKIYDANTMYDFSFEDAESVGDRVLIGNQTLNNFLAKKGITEDRLQQIVDPATGIRILDLPKDQQKAYWRKRGIEGTQRWMNMGGRSVGDGYSEVHVPGFHAQMEHQNPFSGSIDVIGDKSDYYSDTKFNQAGSLERYENAEKNDIDTVDYHRARRANIMSMDAGNGRLELGKTSMGREAVDGMIADSLPAIEYSQARLKADREGTVNINNVLKGLALMRDVNKLYAA